MIGLYAHNQLSAQNAKSDKSHYLSFKPQFIQIKEAANYGYVFNGLNLSLNYSFELENDQRISAYSPSIAFGALYKKGIALAFQIRPIDLFYGFRLHKIKPFKFYLGPYMALNYQWQLYPELQSGHMFWFTAMEIGPKIATSFDFNSRAFKATFSNSLAGWISRPELETEEYFYSLTIPDYIQNAHEGLTFGFNDLFNHTKISIESLTRNARVISLGYQFEYFVHYKHPELSFMIHGINLKWKLNKKGKQG